MKKLIKSKYISWYTGFIRFNKVEINWEMNDWALPLSISFENYSYQKLVFFRILCISLIISNNKL